MLVHILDVHLGYFKCFFVRLSSLTERLHLPQDDAERPHVAHEAVVVVPEVLGRVPAQRNPLQHTGGETEGLNTTQFPWQHIQGLPQVLFVSYVTKCLGSWLFTGRKYQQIQSFWYEMVVIYLRMTHLKGHLSSFSLV